MRPGARFSASEAAFTGFRLLAREPVTWAVWTLAFLVFSLIIGAGMVVMVGPSMTELMASAGTPNRDPAAAMAMFSRILPFEGLVLVASLAVYALAFAAVNRAVLRPGAGGPGRFGLGEAELHQLLVLVIIWAVLFAVYIAAVILGVIVAVIVGVAAATVGASTGAGAMAPAAVLAFIGVGVLILAPIVWVMVRLSLASPMTFDLGRVEVFGSWRLTRGRFWALFGAYLISFLVSALLYLVAFLVIAVVAVTVGGGLKGAGVMLHPDMTSLSTYFSPIMVLWLVVSSALAAMWMAVSVGAPAGAYAQLRDLGLMATPAAATPGPASDLPRFGN